jgi:hypothetical protein
MNFGLTGPIADRELLVEKDLIGIDVAEHRHRVNGLKDLAARDCPRMIVVLTQNCSGMGAWSAWSESTSRKNFNFSVRLDRESSHSFSSTLSHKTFPPRKKKSSRKSSRPNSKSSTLTNATMGTGKKEKNRKIREGKTGDGFGNVKVKGENFYRSAKKVKALNILTKGTAQHNAKGEQTKAASFQSRQVPQARVEPNRKWFTNSRVIGQDALNNFREAMAERASDPYSVLLKSNKLPMTLIRDGQGKNGIKEHQAKMTVEASPFGDVFGPKAQRKRVKIGASSLEDMAEHSIKSHDTYLDRLEQAKLLSGNSGVDTEAIGEAGIPDDGHITSAREAIFNKGQSKRIWNELYKVIDSSDVVIHVVDARDPLGTRCRSVEKYIREEAPHKHLIFVLNKCDLVPTGVAVSTPFFQ